MKDIVSVSYRHPRDERQIDVFPLNSTSLTAGCPPPQLGSLLRADAIKCRITQQHHRTLVIPCFAQCSQGCTALYLDFGWTAPLMR
ncbi:uncharacterized protein BO96DRAFT_128859 [Aspergillus niger CBS 101883]|uniref:uncharacterized protein n=1 Tax=Aspergillus lacticoffeatus (strain CBS 101883) TaxID=1450533 RepID=UPI000D7F4724|nr:uncharacterized protein BO96DRAFT_128859 [Aspergillus niger CBS 101883]PYH53467.1 hypothetical protein BO96DRAFT_128859 [Aspergillus niger CBS 101883]